MTKKIIVACGGAVATSTIAANKIKELCAENNIDVQVEQCRVTELDMKADHADLMVTTARVDKEYGVPVVHGVAFISGIGLEKTEQQIIEILQR